MSSFSDDARKPLGLRAELLWALALKLLLVWAIKVAFFSHPMSKEARQQALEAQLTLAPPVAVASAPIPPEKGPPHDQRDTR